MRQFPREGRVRYEFQRREKIDPNLTLGDGEIDILINALGDTAGCSDEMKEFLAALVGNVIGNGIGREIDAAVREAKNHLSWRTEYMLLEQMLLEERNEGKEEGLKQGIEIGTERGIEIGTERGVEIGKEEGIRELAVRLWNKGYSAEDIAELCGKTSDTIRKWIAEVEMKDDSAECS